MRALVGTPKMYGIKATQNTVDNATSPYYLADDKPPDDDDDGYNLYYFTSLNELSTGRSVQITEKLSGLLMDSAYSRIALPAGKGKAFNLTLTGRFFFIIVGQSKYFI